MSEFSKRFWKKNWDEGLDDLKPKEFDTTIITLIGDKFKKYPENEALIFKGVKITYKELDMLSNQFANLLISNGFKKGDVVGVNLPNIPYYVIAILGALKAGCIISGVSPLLSEDQMESQLSDLGSGKKKIALLTLDVIYEAKIRKFATGISNLRLVMVTSIDSFLSKWKRTITTELKELQTGKITLLEGKKVLDLRAHVLEKKSTEPPDIEINSEDIAFIQYTGGKTGPAKGAMLTHRNVASDLLIVQEWLGWEVGNGLGISAFPYFHIGGLFFCLQTLYIGWATVLIPKPRDTSHFCKEMKKFRPKALVNVPSLYQLLLINPLFRKLKHSTLEVCISSASPFPVKSQKELEKIIGKGKLLEVYGMTETSPVTIMNPVKGEKKLGSIGLPILNTEIKLVNPETGDEVTLGEPGEICVKGPMVMKGYYNKPDETAKVIDSEGYMHTGDVAVMDEEGYLKIVDLAKDMIIVSGFKVFPTKVEESLIKHPAVGEIATIGIPNPERPGSEIVKAIIKIDPGYDSDEDEEALKKLIMDYAKEKLAPYEVPKFIKFLDELPLTTGGKVNKKLLQTQETEKKK
jgi:long-chain acyl-CoA synthetase